jgi:hypothetical protein
MFKHIIVIALVVFIGSFRLNAQSAEDLGKIKFTGIASIQVVGEGKDLIALVKAEIANQSSSEILVADGAYNVTFQRGGKPFIKLAFAHPTGEATLPKGSVLSAGKGFITFAVLLGDDSAATTNDVLIPLFNLIASNEGKLTKADKAPEAITIILDGKIRYGVKAGEATVFHTEEIRWTLTPKPTDHLVFAN